MRSPRVEGPPVLQPVGESSTPITPKESEVEPAEETKSENEKPPTPPMPVLVEGEDFYDNDDVSSFEVLDELNTVNSTGSTKKGSVTKSPSTSLSNGIISKEVNDFKPLLNDFPMNSDERLNGDHEEPVLEKFFRLYTPSTQDVIQSDIVNDYFSRKLECKSDKKIVESTVTESVTVNAEAAKPTLDSQDETSTAVNSECSKVTSPTKRRRVSRKGSTGDGDGSPSPKRLRRKKPPTREETPTASETNDSAVQERKTEAVSDRVVSEDFTEENTPSANRKTQRKSPQRPRGRPPKNLKASPGKPGKKPVKKDKVNNTVSAPEMRYMRSPYIVSTSESDSIVSRFQVVNPALRDAAAVNILDHPFRHTVKVVPVSTLSVKPWVCVFCGHGTTFNELGCLFGPYLIDLEKANLPADSIYPLENTESQNVPEAPALEPMKSTPPSPHSSSPETIPTHPPLPPPPPPPPPPPSYSPPASPINKTDEVLLNGDQSESEEASEVSATSKPETELANESNSSASCRKTRSGRQSKPKSYDDDWRPSSISSFRYSKARNCQPIIVAKDIRKTNDDAGKKTKGVKQIDIAAMFFSTDQNKDEKLSGSGHNNQSSSVDKSKRVSSRRKSEPPAAQVYEELTRKFNLRLDRTDAIPKKNVLNSSSIKKEKVETIIKKNSTKDNLKVDIMKPSKESNDFESEIQTDKFEADSKIISSDAGNYKIVDLDKSLSVKIESKVSMQILKDYQSYNKQHKSSNGANKRRGRKSPTKSRVVSAKKVAKAKLQTAKQTAKNKHSKEAKSDSQSNASISECKVIEEDTPKTFEESVVKIKRPRGRPPKSSNDSSPNSKSLKVNTKTNIKESQRTQTTKMSEKSKVEPSKDKNDMDIYKDARLSSNGEVWFHMECVLWTSGTFLDGKTVVGLEETLSVALQTMCKSCNTRGAMLACVQRGCDKTYHFFCAVREGAYLDNDQFCIYCAKHKAKILFNKLSVHQQLPT